MDTDTKEPAAKTTKVQLLNQTLLKGVVLAVLLLFYGALITNKIPLPAAEDLPRQMKNGEMILHGDFSVLTKNVYSYTEPDHHFANHHWLYGVVMYLMHAIIGWGGMVVFKVLFLLFSFWLLFWLALKKADFWLVAVLSVPTLLALASRSDLRPEMFGYFFVIFYIFLLNGLKQNPKSNTAFWLIPVQLLWANLHITFAIGVFITLGFLLEQIVLHRFSPLSERFSFRGFQALIASPLIKKLVILSLALILVSFINPNGISGTIYSLTANTTSDSPVASAEVQPLSAAKFSPRGSNLPAAMFPVLLIVLTISFVIGFRKKPVFYLLASVATIIMSYFIIRSLPFFFIIFLLATSSNLNEIFLRLKIYLKTRWPIYLANLEPIIYLVLIISMISYMVPASVRLSTSYEKGLGLTRHSTDAINFFNEHKLNGPIFNDTDIGSYLIYYLYPKQKVFADNRFVDAYSTEFFKNIYQPALTQEGWKQAQEKFHFNTIFLYQYDQGFGIRDFISNRLKDPEWALVFYDQYSVIFVKNIPENQDLISKYQITSTNLELRLNNLMISKTYDDQIAIPDLYALFGYPGTARFYYEKVVSIWPSRGKVWFTLGRGELLRGDQANADTALALLFVQRAIDNGWVTPDVYSYLALAYYRLGDLEKAEAAVKKELRLNPSSIDGQQWVGTLAKAKARALQPQDE